MPVLYIYFIPLILWDVITSLDIGQFADPDDEKDFFQNITCLSQYVLPLWNIYVQHIVGKCITSFQTLQKDLHISHSLLTLERCFAKAILPSEIVRKHGNSYNYKIHYPFGIINGIHTTNHLH